MNIKKLEDTDTQYYKHPQSNATYAVVRVAGVSVLAGAGVVPGKVAAQRVDAARVRAQALVDILVERWIEKQVIYRKRKIELDILKDEQRERKKTDR